MAEGSLGSGHQDDRGLARRRGQSQSALSSQPDHRPSGLNARNVLITGGSSGIGAEAVRVFSEHGDTVWFTYHHGRARAEQLIAELTGRGCPPPRAFAFDQGDPAGHQALLAALPGRVDVLINNAAVGSKTVEDAAGTPQSQDEMFIRINCLGPLWLKQALLPAMIENGFGKIILVSSVDGGIAAFPGFRDSDGMSKAALAFLARQWAAELSHAPVDVLCVCPGAVDTPMFRKSTLDPLLGPEAERLIARLPRGRLIEPQEIAGLLWFLASPVAGVLHGAVIDASMGLGAHPGLITAG